MPHITEPPSPARRVAFQGVRGAFSHQACLDAAPEAEPVAFETFAAVFQAVAEGACELAVVPVENSIAGPVPDVARLLPESRLKVTGEYLLPIRLQLLGLHSAHLGDVEVAASHPMALAQCRRTLQALGLRPEPAFDTAGAAAALTRAQDPRRAAVASAAAEEIYGLKVLRADIEDAPGNVTRFLLLQRPG